MADISLLMLNHLFAIAILVFSALLPASGASRADDAPEIFDLSTTIDGTEYRCKVVINTEATKGGAALLFLHGSGECGDDGEKMLHVGLPRYAKENPEMWPFVLIVPQKPTVDSEWEDHDKAVLRLLDDAAERGLYDPERLGITGLSQGGHGTITIASRHPDRFVAAAPVCPYVERVWDEDGVRHPWGDANADAPAFKVAAKALSSIPTWIHHGDSDVVVSVEQSRSLHKALDAIDADTRYSEYEGVNHNSWDNAYTDPEFAAWFLEHTSE
jgi:predicted peptidase